MKEYGAAITDLREAIRLNPADSWALEQLQIAEREQSQEQISISLGFCSFEISKAELSAVRFFCYLVMLGLFFVPLVWFQEFRCWPSVIICVLVLVLASIRK
jgi:hypothetical protein